MKKKVSYTNLVLFSFFIIPVFLGLVFIAPAEADESAKYTVPQLVDMALDASYVMGESRENLLASKAKVYSAMTDFLPKASAAYSHTALKETPFRVYQDSYMAAYGVPAFEAKTASDSIVTWNVSLVQPLFTGFALTSKYRMAKLDESISEQKKKQARLDVQKTAETACYDYLLAQKILKVATEAKNSYKAHTQEAELYYKQGLIPYNDLLKFQVAQAEAVQKLAQAKAAVRVAAARINLLLNRDMNTALAIEDIHIKEPSRTTSLDACIATAMTRRPVLNIINLGIKNLDQAVRLTQSKYYPTIALVGRYEQKGDDNFAQHNDFDNSHNASITVNATWAFFEWGKTSSDASALSHQRRALSQKLKEIKNNVTLEIRHIHENVDVSMQNIKTAEQALSQARENLRITELQYRQQAATSTDVLDARTFLTRADTNYYQAVYGYMTQLAGLKRVIGSDIGSASNGQSFSDPL